jgi:hypothetical protein
MKVDDLYPSKYLKSGDLNGQTVRVTIDRYEIELIGQGAQADRKPVMYFRGKAKGMILNKTNARTLQQSYGPELDDWIGAEIELFVVMTEMNGETKEGLRVRVARKQPQRVHPQGQPVASERTPPPAPLDDDVPF